MSRFKTQAPKSIFISGKNSVFEALKCSADIEKLYIYNNLDPRQREGLERLAKGNSIPIEYKDREELEKISKTPSNQGVAAKLRIFEILDVKSALRMLEKKATGRLIVALDSINDPQNMGAIIRTCSAAGVDLLVLNESHSCAISDTVFRISQGGIFHLPICIVSNLVNSINRVKELGFWVYGFENIGQNSYTDTEFSKDCVLLFGSEGEGLRNLTRKNCDLLVNIPISGAISSLNVSVATALGVFEVLRQRRISK